jgi:ABC-2 type transport system permease protein
MKIILHIIKKEFLQFKRDPKMFAITIIAPILQLVLLGYAATLDVKKVHTLVYDMSRTVESRQFVEEFESSGFFHVDYYAHNYDEVTQQLDKGSVILALVIPYNFADKLNRKETIPVQALFNGSDGNTASIAAGYVARVVQGYAGNLVQVNLEKSGRKFLPVASIDPEIRVWYNPYLVTRYFMVPGIVGLLLSVITLILTSLAVVKEKEIGTLEQLVVTPIKSYQLILGKLIPFVIIGFVAVTVVLTGMRVVFDIPIRGSIFFLFFSAFLYILSALGLGLFVSTISKTQQQAMMVAIFAVLMPMVFLSGFTFPLENMPRIIQFISYVIPLRYFITIIRGVILKGLGLSDLWGEALMLLVMGIIIFVLSSLRFHKRLE